MSPVYFLYGIVALLGLALTLAVSMTSAARAAAHLLGIASFRWFDPRPAPAASWRWLLLRLASVLAPLALSLLLFFCSLYVAGAPQATSTRVEVLDGPALMAGLRSGDRVLRVGGEPIGDFEELRGAVRQSRGAVPVEVERDGQRLLLEVTPRGGKIGVAPLPQMERMSALAAARRALPMPFLVVQGAARDLARATTGAAKSDLMGPVAIVRETSKAQRQSGFAFLSLLAVLAGHFWLFAAGVVVFDVVTGYIFRAAHPAAASSSQRGYRLERLRQASLFACAGYATFILAAGFDAAEVPYARLPLMLAVVTGVAGYPLIWSGGKEVWGRPVAALVLAGSILVPCVLMLVVLALHFALGRALEGEGFRVTWVSAQPPLAPTEQTRWGT